MLVIKTIDGITTIAPSYDPRTVWTFDDAEEARGFIAAWWSDDVASVSVEPISGRMTYDYTGVWE